jgi:hypothetical protein
VNENYDIFGYISAQPVVELLHVMKLPAIFKGKEAMVET